MILPSIDILGGRAVQLVGGKPGAPGALDLGDPLALAERLAVAGELAVVDLDAALGRGDNRALIVDLVRRTDCRVGGGIRDLGRARDYLDAGATKIILGTAATPELLGQLPRERLIAALDESDGRVVVRGWQERTAATVAERLDELAPYVSGFLVTSVDREGRNTGLDERLATLLAAQRGLDLVIAGGIRSVADIRRADELGLVCQVGMALHTGALDLGEAIAAPLVSDRPDGLWPTAVVDEEERLLGLCYSSLASLKEAVARRRGVYWSRRRGRWEKGAESGSWQELRRVDLDCDRDALRFTVSQHGVFCHRGTETCFGGARGLAALAPRLAARRDHPDRGPKHSCEAAVGPKEVAEPGSYVARLLADPALLAAKLVEEAGELAAAAAPGPVAAEAADLLFFAHVALTRAGVPLAAAARELDLRARRLTRRPGDAKP